MKNILEKILFLTLMLPTVGLFGELVDTDGNAATNETPLGDIDMGVGTLGDLKIFMFPGNYWAVSNNAMTVGEKATNYTDFVALGK